MSTSRRDPDEMGHLGILGRAMARARGDSDDESPTESDRARELRWPNEKPPAEPPACEYLGVVVGVDGVFTHGRFIPHSEIREIRHDPRERLGWGWGDITEGPTVAWSVSIALTSGRVMKLTDDLEVGDGAGLVHALARDLESAHKAWRAARSQPVPEAASLARGKQTGAAWLGALRRLGSGSGPYRTAPAELEQVAQILDNPRAKPWSRAAAAVVLSSSGDTTAATKLGKAADALASPMIRAALHTVSEGRSDAAIAAALDTLAAADQEKPRR
jgi:hypothetical protein